MLGAKFLKMHYRIYSNYRQCNMNVNFLFITFRPKKLLSVIVTPIFSYQTSNAVKFSAVKGLTASHDAEAR